MKTVKAQHPGKRPIVRVTDPDEDTEPGRKAPSPPPVHAEVSVETFPRVAGRERCRLYNDWLEATFECFPGSLGTFEWRAAFKDGDGISQTWSGSASTRREAGARGFDAMTKKISASVEARKAWLERQAAATKLSEAAGLGVGEHDSDVRPVGGGGLGETTTGASQ